MEDTVLIKGVAEIILSIILCLFSFFISFRLSSYMTKEIDNQLELKNNNIALAIIETAYILVISIFMIAVITPTIKLIFGIEYLSVENILTAIAKIVMFYVVAIALSYLIIFFSIKFFLIFSGIIDENREIKKGNISVALIISSFMFTITYVLISPFRLLISSFSPPLEELKFGLRSHFIDISLFSETLLQMGTLIIAFIYIILISFVTINLLIKGTKADKEIRKDNIALAFVISSIVFAMMFMIKGVIFSLYGKLFVLIEELHIQELILNFLIYFILFIIIVHAVLAINVFITINSFKLFNKNIDAIKEIKLKKISVGIIVGTMIIVFNFFIANGVSLLIK